jgi:hypothetical protein
MLLFSSTLSIYYCLWESVSGIPHLFVDIASLWYKRVFSFHLSRRHSIDGLWLVLHLGNVHTFAMDA